VTLHWQPTVEHIDIVQSLQRNEGECFQPEKKQKQKQKQKQTKKPKHYNSLTLETSTSTSKVTHRHLTLFFYCSNTHPLRPLGYEFTPGV